MAFLNFSDPESLLESDSDLEPDEHSSDEVYSVSEELDVLLLLEIPFAFFLISSESLYIKKNVKRHVKPSKESA